MDKPLLKNKDYLTVIETARLFGVSLRKLSRLVEKDNLPFMAMYRTRRLVIRDEFAKYLEQPGVRGNLISVSPMTVKEQLIKAEDNELINAMKIKGLEELKMKNISLGEKYTLTIKESATYFNIGVKRMRELAEGNLGVFSLICGNRYLIIRTKFEEYLCSNSTI